MAPTPNTDPGTLSEPTGQAWEPRSLVAAITEPCGFDPDMRKPLSEYLRRVGPRGTSFMMTSCIIIALQESFSSAFPSGKVRRYFLTFMKEYVDITPRLGAWSEKPSDKAFTGQRPPPPQSKS
jgi:hypothetical protein